MQQPRSSLQGEAMKALGLGVTWALATGLFTWIGTHVDGWLGISPVATVVGMLIGGTAGFVYFYHHAVVEPRRRDRDQDRG